MLQSVPAGFGDLDPILRITKVCVGRSNQPIPSQLIECSDGTMALLGRERPSKQALKRTRMRTLPDQIELVFMTCLQGLQN
jgi:hypothetical protein